jgi:hypothetical protein
MAGVMADWLQMFAAIRGKVVASSEKPDNLEDEGLVAERRPSAPAGCSRHPRRWLGKGSGKKNHGAHPVIVRAG